MGQHFITPVHAGIRQRDDYGATAGNTLTPACLSFTTPKKKNVRIMRSFLWFNPDRLTLWGG
ncbi:hypothetical protein [Erwinia sp. E_sp_W01_6]|uniref:hypothetical protein n=1 Tax=Erwinia sp. E_sp_W01_6 TaxID=3039408 RepID=UPI0030CFF295